jgi:hypothetical protein
MTNIFRIVFIASVCLSAGFARAESLTYRDLLKKPDLRPTQCALKKPLEFQSGLRVKAGQKLDILEFNPNEIVLAQGRASFGVSPDDTDVMSVAEAAVNALTPKQRSLTVAEAMKRPELWPYKLHLKDSFDIGRQRFKKGDVVYLMAIEKGELVVVPPSFSLHTELKPEDTDFLEQARQYVETGAPGRVVEELKGKLVNGQTGQPQPVDPKTIKYYVIYHGARWCPYTQKFTPQLLKLYNEMKQKHPEYEVIYFPAEKSAAELQTYAKEMNFPWPVVTFNQKEKLAVFAHILGRSSTPELGVVDQYGNIILDNAELDRDTALLRLKKMIES